MYALVLATPATKATAMAERNLVDAAMDYLPGTAGSVTGRTQQPRSETGRALVDITRDTHPDLIVLFVTGYTRNAVHNGMLNPCVRLLSKPFTVSDPARKLQAALEERRDRAVSTAAE